jgi:hypothetical protein
LIIVGKGDSHGVDKFGGKSDVVFYFNSKCVAAWQVLLRPLGYGGLFSPQKTDK